MEIKLSFVGWLRFGDLKSGDRIQVESGTAVSDLLTQFEVDPKKQRYIKPFVHNEEVRQTHVLQDGDELLLVIAVGGG